MHDSPLSNQFFVYILQWCLFCSSINKYLLQVSLAAKQLIHGLLQRDPSSRLGSSAGANDIKQHPFFKDIYWSLIRCMVIWKLSLWRVSCIIIVWYSTNIEHNSACAGAPRAWCSTEANSEVKPEEDTHAQIVETF